MATKKGGGGGGGDIFNLNPFPNGCMGVIVLVGLVVFAVSRII